MNNSAMPGSAGQSTALIRPKLIAEQVLIRLLNLIRNSKSIKDFTPEYLSKMMGVEFVTYQPGYHAFGEQMTRNWSYSLEMDENNKPARFTLRFTAKDPNAASVPMTDICQVDFDRFSSELESMNFTRTPNYGEFDRLIDVTFTNSRFGVVVQPRGEGNRLVDGKPRNCVQMVFIG